MATRHIGEVRPVETPLYHFNQVKYDRGNRVYIKHNNNYKNSGKLSGLCGNFDGETSKYYIKRDGSQVGDVKAFVSSWLVSSSSSCQDAIKHEPCEENPDRKNWAIKGEWRFYYCYFHHHLHHHHHHNHIIFHLLTGSEVIKAKTQTKAY